MFNSRRFLATLLIAAVLSAGFGLLPSPLVQNTPTYDSELCDKAIEVCDGYWKIRDQLCAIFGSNSATCIQATADTMFLCAYYITRFCYVA